ncbi:MAG: class I SAM-dependent methyltransferase [Pyrinomonadaceae bacterium]|nr:class I SAM-dependent methyltransferase [Phycisphaerales bacterium]
MPASDKTDLATKPCAEYLAPYRRAVNRIGPCFEALLWANLRSQTARFRTISQMIDLSDLCVLDAGCGRADLAAYLVEQRINYARYLGVDAIPELLEAARGRSIARASFRLCDFVSDPTALQSCQPSNGARTPEAEVIVFSGSLNTLPRERAMAVLERAWECCTHALVFNFLSTLDGAEPCQDEFRAHRMAPVAVLEWALARTRDVSLRHDYLDGRDGTVCMRKV